VYPLKAIYTNLFTPPSIVGSGSLYNIHVVQYFSKTTDGGMSWINIIPPATGAITALSIDPFNCNTVYAYFDEYYNFGGVGGSFQKSTDGGETWAYEYADNHIGTIAIDPKNSQVIYAGINPDPHWQIGFAMLKSIDGGSNWSKLDLPNLNLIKIDPSDSQIIYAVTNNKVVYKSYDRGLSWRPISNLVGSTETIELVIDPSNTQILYALSNGKPFKSTNGGESWAASDEVVHAIVIDPTNASIMYKATIKGVFKSINGGAFWSQTNDGLTALNVKQLVIDPMDPQHIYAGTSYGVFQGTSKIEAPTISGATPSNAEAGSFFSFTPTATDAAGFSISNKPSWATFDTTTGTLSGTSPTVGFFSNIQISVSNGFGRTENLPPFSISIFPSGGTPVPVMEGWWLLPGMLAGVGIFARRRKE